MYEGHFHLVRRPFAATPDPGCCYLSPTQAPLFQAVGRCIEHGQGVAILTGPAGIGKTLLSQVLLAASESRFTGVYLGTGQFPTRRALLQAILYELGQSYGGMTDQELRLELNTALRNLITQKDGLLLILDEAHLLTDRLLEEIRLLADLAQHGVPLTRVVLCGNPEFEERLTSPALAAFNQRVACHVVLETMTRPESIDYLEHRIRWAGGIVERLFERNALQLIADASDGVPRCLNQLADHSLMRAYLAGQEIVTASLVRQTLAELQHLPLRWNPSALHDRSQRQTPEMVEAADVVDERPEPHHSADEVADQDESPSCCFEFGAGDGEAAGESSGFIPAPATMETALEVAVASSEMECVEVAQPELASDDDGPPLFPWLAKSTSGNDSMNSVAEDDFSSSSFTIPARRRLRPQVVEQEVVSTVPLSGAELLTKRLPNANRPLNSTKSPLTPRELPAEEVVVDEYACLDCRLTPVFPLPALGFPVVSIPLNNPESRLEAPTRVTAPAASQAPNTELPTASTGHQADSFGNPLEEVDAICSLLDTPEGSVSSGGVELITDYGVERIDIDLPADTRPLTGLATPDQEPIDREDWIGSIVVEVGRNLQRTLASSFPDQVNKERATKIEQLLDGIERATRRDYDVVEPDQLDAGTAELQEATSATDQFAEAGPGVVPPPKHGYKNFFTMLRRRQIRQDVRASEL